MIKSLPMRGSTDFANANLDRCAAEEGWLREEKGICEATKYAQTGWCWFISIIFLDQHHPGAHQEMGHPSSAADLSKLAFAKSVKPRMGKRWIT